LAFQSAMLSTVDWSWYMKDHSAVLGSSKSRGN
jgi:hypothetical protein